MNTPRQEKAPITKPLSQPGSGGDCDPHLTSVQGSPSAHLLPSLPLSPEACLQVRQPIPSDLCPPQLTEVSTVQYELPT